MLRKGRAVREAASTGRKKKSAPHLIEEAANQVLVAAGSKKRSVSCCGSQERKDQRLDGAKHPTKKVSLSSHMTD